MYREIGDAPAFGLVMNHFDVLRSTIDAADGAIVAPGFIDTDMVEDVPKEEVLDRIPMRRFGTPEEVAAVAVFLCSQQAAYLTGQTIVPEGGAVASIL